ncbi:MAG: hypothetical protein HQL17_02575 [Candidatus Omnitrophica bacterium]|nr:hypothetical protein [Candidatus Omnitrophota bacterium]
MQEYYSTIDAAKICGVTRFSVINWTNKGMLKTTKTPGGHRRIYRGDLFSFIKTYKIGLNAFTPKEFASAKQDFLRCWDFHHSSKRTGVHNCKRCVVFTSDTKKCFALREHVSHQKIFCKTSCADCGYFSKVHA